MAQGIVRSKLSLDQAARMNVRLAEMMQLQGEVLRLGGEGWMPKYLRRTGIPFQWGWAYELSVAEMIVLMTLLTGSLDELRDAIDQGYEAFLALPDAIEKQADAAKPKRRIVIAVYALLCALVHSMRAIGYHSQSMDELIARGLRGDALALRRAIAIDPTALAMPSVAAHVTKMHIVGDRTQLRQLYNAAGKGPNKQLQPNWQLRYFERILREGSVFRDRSREDVFHMIVDKTRLYDGRGGDAFKGLFTLFDRWREDATT